MQAKNCKMMQTVFYALLLLIFNISDSVYGADSIRIIIDGRSDYSILLSPNPSSEEIRAAGFLQSHLMKMTECELPVLIGDTLFSGPFISISKCSSLAEGDSYTIRTLEKNLIIKGGNAKGCIYAISEILEQHLGIRYYSPEFIKIPAVRDVTLPYIDVSGSSPNTYRNVNRQFSLNDDYRDFHRTHIFEDMFAQGYFVHTFHRLIPWQEHFESNPEYYAWMNGKRIIDQLCLTHPQVFDLVIMKLKEEMTLQPEKKVWSVSQDDNFSYCQCEQCTKVIEDEESPSGPIIRFVNRVADSFPDKVISTLAYQYSRKAPKLTIPRKNVQIMLCTIELNRSKPISNDPASESFLKDLEEWTSISDHIFLWDYTVNFAHLISPFPNIHVLQTNIRLFVENGVREHFQQSNTGTGRHLSELKSYIISKLLWDPDADVRELIREFTDGYYGPAGKWIMEYIYTLENELLKTGEQLDIYGPPTNHQHSFLSQTNIEKYKHFFDEAEKAVIEYPHYHLHVRTARMSLQYAIMEIGKSDMFGPRGWYIEEADDFVLRKDMIKTLEEFYHTSIECNSAPVNESGLTTEAYYLSTKRFIDVQVKGNLAFRKTATAEPMPAEKYSNGDFSILTNGVRGANDFKVHWLGWEATDFKLILDMEDIVSPGRVEISTLYDPKSWILHPASVTCMISQNGADFTVVEMQKVEGDQQKEEVNRLFSFGVDGKSFRYVNFEVKGTKQLFDWHPSAGGGSWVFVDEIVVR